MTTYTLQAIKRLSRREDDEIIITSVETVQFEIVSSAPSSAFNYIFAPEPYPIDGEDLPNGIINIANDNSAYVGLDGFNLLTADPSFTHVGQIERDGVVTYVLDLVFLRQSVGNSDVDYIIPIGGAPLPEVNTVDEFNALNASITAAGPIEAGSFAPNTPIPLSSLLNVIISQNDTLVGDASAETFQTGDGDDRVEGGGGDDVLDGGEGQDTAVFAATQEKYTLSIAADGTTITDRSGITGTDRLISIETLDFESGTFNLEQFGGLASVSATDLQSFIELYIAYFNRAPDAVGLSFWGTAFANGTSLSEMATLFIDQPETRATYDGSASNTVFVNAVYANVLGRVGDQAGVDFWLAALEAGSVGRDQFILGVLGGAKTPIEGATAAQAAQQAADTKFLSDKTDLGTHFAISQGMSNVSNAVTVMQTFDGSQSSLDAAIATSAGFYASAQDAVDGEFLLPIIGVLDDPFA